GGASRDRRQRVAPLARAAAHRSRSRGGAGLGRAPRQFQLERLSRARLARGRTPGARRWRPAVGHGRGGEPADLWRLPAAPRARAGAGEFRGNRVGCVLQLGLRRQLRARAGVRGSGGRGPLRRAQPRQPGGRLPAVSGPHGAGLVSQLGLGGRIDLRMGTLSKAAGAFGAFVAATRSCCELLVNRARTLVFSTALPPAVPHAALAALRILEGPEGDELRARLRRNVERFAVGLRSLGLPAQAATPIFPVVLGAPQAALFAAAQLRKR